MLETLLAGVVLLLCGALLLRLALPPARRQRLHLQLQRGWSRLKHLSGGAPRQWLRQRRSHREAHDVIERARRRSAGGDKVERDGNVLRPDRFKPPTDRDTLH